MAESREAGWVRRRCERQGRPGGGPIPVSGTDRYGRHGRGVARLGRAIAPRSRHQGTAGASRARRGGRRAGGTPSDAGGSDHRPAAASARDSCIRRGRARRPALPDHGIRPVTQPAKRAHGAQYARHRRGRRGRQSDCRSTKRGALRRDRSPRCQAGQRAAGRGRHREADRLRHLPRIR